MNSQPYNRRVVTVQIPDEFVHWLFQDGAHAENGLPKDARLVRWNRRPELDTWDATFQSEKFDLVPEAAQIPVRTLYGDPTRDQCESLDWTKPDRGGLSKTSNKYGRNSASLSLSYEIFSSIFRDGNVVEHELPEDAELWKVWDVPQKQRIEAGFFSDEFEDSEPGQEKPRIDNWSVRRQSKADQPISNYKTTG